MVFMNSVNQCRRVCSKYIGVQNKDDAYHMLRSITDILNSKERDYAYGIIDLFDLCLEQQ